MIWILNMIVSANLRRVSLGISANGSRLGEVRDKINQNFKLKTKTYRYARNFD